MTTRLPPGPKTAGFLLELPRFRRGVLPYFAGLSRRVEAPLIHIQFGPGASYIVNHPDTVREMLVLIPERFSRSRWLGELRHLVGAGLLTSDEDAWVPQRRRLNPAYLGRHREAVDEATGDETARALARWRGTVDVQHEAKRILLRALVRIMMSPDMPVDEQALIADLDALLQYVSMRTKFVRDNLSLAGIRLRREAAMRGVIARLDAFIAAVVDGCRSGEMRAGLMLETLLPAEARGEVDAANLHDEIGTLLLAGFDTTAALVTFALWHLADRPDLAAAVRDEAADPAGGRAVTDTVLRETLRLYPAVWAIHRTAAEDIEIGGYRIPRGEHVMAVPYALQRNPAFWPEPDRFVPERFLGAPDNDALLGLEYLPFSHGRHTCIGKRMAMQQARLMVGQVVTAVDLARVGPLPRLVPGVILKASGGLPLRATPRAA